MRSELSLGGMCAACLAGALHCLACGRVITDRLVEINGRGPYCEACYATRQHCDVCSAPLDGAAQRLPDGRAICGACQQTAILDAAQAKSVFDQTEAIVGRALGLSLRVGVRFVVTDRPGMRTQVRKMQPGLVHAVDDVMGAYVREGRRRTIYVQNGLPRILLAQVAAHEWAHAWQMENCPLVRDVLVVEGFAEWVAYKVLQAMGAVKKMALMTARPDLYGEGLRLMLGRETREGLSGVLALCAAQPHVLDGSPDPALGTSRETRAKRGVF